MASQKPPVLDEDAKLDYLEKKAKKKYKNQVRKYRREAENDIGELNIIPMLDMMTILLVFLIMSYGAAEINVAMGEDLTPPSSTSTLEPIQTITLTVTKKDIAVGERSVVTLEVDENGLSRIPDSVKDPSAPLVIVPIKEALEAELERLQRIVDYNPIMRARVGTDKDPMKMLTVVGDQDLPYDLLFSVLGTAGQAQLKYFKFLVISKHG